MEYTVENFRVGMRVEAHPATDLFMRGARYGTVVGIGTLVRCLVRVKFDKLDRAYVPMHPRNLLIVD